jgi:O-antigen/teichoic acid export membrane protein
MIRQTDHTEDTKRIAKNTMMLYIQMFFSMIVSLYTSRVLLNALGVSDFGTYNVVGGLVAMFSLISSSLSGSVSRFITYELGKGGDPQNVRRIFSTSLLIHIGLAVIVIFAMETIGVWFLNAKMVIASERLTAANWVFQGSIVSFSFGLLGVPYNATIIAHEKMSAFSYITILQVTLNLLNVIFIAYSPWHFDRLICYALLTVGVSVLIQIVYMVYCRIKFEECYSLKLIWDNSIWKGIAGFSAWMFIGSLSSRLKWDGVNILLNLFLGTVVNAARGIAGSVNGAISAFATNFMTAINPQITKSYASGDYHYMLSLVLRGTRFSLYILSIIILPFMFETDFILTIWLKHFPKYTLNFTRLALILTFFDMMSNTLGVAQSSTGKIKWSQIYVSSILLLNFPLSYLCLKLGLEPESVIIVAIVLSLITFFVRMLVLKHYLPLSIKVFLKEIFLNLFFVILISIIVPIIAYFNMPESWLRFICVSILCITCCIISIFFIGFSDDERNLIKRKLLDFIHNLNCKFIKI